MIGPRIVVPPLVDKLPLFKQLNEMYRGLASSAHEAQAELAREDPRDFIRDVLGRKPTPAALKHGYKDPWTPDQDRMFESVITHRKTAVAAGVSVGKTDGVAALVLWWLYSKSPSIVVTTSSSWTQVEKVLWAQIRTMWQNSKLHLPGVLLQTELKLSDERFAIGLSTTPTGGDISATRMQGLHSPNLMGIIDEATGVRDEVWEAIEGLAVRPTDRIVATGNPTDPGSRFKKTFDMSTWHPIHIDCRNHPNVLKDDPDIIPGATSKEWIEERLAEYGSEDAPLYVAKVTGQFPEQASDALINVGWITKSQVRWEAIGEELLEAKHRSDGRGLSLGMDVAGEGEDMTVLWAIEEGRLFMPRLETGYTWHVGRDVMKAVALIVNVMKANLDQYGFTRVRSIALDDTGLGHGVSARLGELQHENSIPKFALNDDRRPRHVEIQPINFGNVALSDDFDRRKDELWWGLRESLRDEKKGIAIPTDAELARYALPRRHSLIAQLSQPFYAPSSSGKILVFDKRGARGGGTDPKTRERVEQLPTSSPDLAHGAMLAVQAWSGVRPDLAKPRPQNAEEAWEKEMRELMQKRHRNNKKPVKAYRGRNW